MFCETSTRSVTLPTASHSNKLRIKYKRFNTRGSRSILILPKKLTQRKMNHQHTFFHKNKQTPKTQKVSPMTIRAATNTTRCHGYFSWPRAPASKNEHFTRRAQRPRRPRRLSMLARDRLAPAFTGTRAGTTRRCPLIMPGHAGDGKPGFFIKQIIRGLRVLCALRIQCLSKLYLPGARY